MLKNGVFEATAAKIGVPMSARLLDASMVTTKVCHSNPFRLALAHTCSIMWHINLWICMCTM